MRTADDPTVDYFDVDLMAPGPGPMGDWISGWFWWRRYETPAMVSITLGAAGEIVFPIYCRWADGEFYEMFLFRYDRVREVVELIHRDPDSHELALDADAMEVVEVEIDSDEFSPDILFSQLAEGLDVALLSEKQASEVLGEEVEYVWEPVDVGQAPAEFATADEVS